MKFGLSVKFKSGGILKEFGVLKQG
jgi:hypothetical protein